MKRLVFVVMCIFLTAAFLWSGGSAESGEKTITLELFQQKREVVDLFDQIIDPAGVKGARKDHLTIHATDWPDLMVNWLRELLFFWNGKELLVKKAEILSITGTRLSARIVYDSYDPGQHTIINEIKAVTYHQIRVEEGPYGWKATVIFDV